MSTTKDLSPRVTRILLKELGRSTPPARAITRLTVNGFSGLEYVIGKTPDQIESVIATALRRNGFESPEVVVSVEAFAPRKIFVLGEINAGADFSCTIPEGGEMTAMQAISAAGGLAESADVEKIIVRRGDASGNMNVLSVPAKDILMGKKAADIRLQPSDTVVVPKAKPISVLGTAKKPGQFLIRPAMGKRM